MRNIVVTTLTIAVAMLIATRVAAQGNGGAAHTHGATVQAVAQSTCTAQNPNHPSVANHGQCVSRVARVHGHAHGHGHGKGNGRVHGHAHGHGHGQKASATPEATDQPEATDLPEPTQQPEATDQPEPTEQPDPAGGGD